MSGSCHELVTNVTTLQDHKSISTRSSCSRRGRKRPQTNWQVVTQDWRRASEFDTKYRKSRSDQARQLDFLFSSVNLDRTMSWHSERSYFWSISKLLELLQNHINKNFDDLYTVYIYRKISWRQKYISLVLHFERNYRCKKILQIVFFLIRAVEYFIYQENLSFECKYITNSEKFLSFSFDKEVVRHWNAV